MDFCWHCCVPSAREAVGTGVFAKFEEIALSEVSECVPVLEIDVSDVVRQKSFLKLAPWCPTKVAGFD